MIKMEHYPTFAGGRRNRPTSMEVRMRSFDASAVINASAESIWSILVDGDRWAEWNPTVDKVEGAIVPGGRVTVFAKLAPGRAFPVRVTAFEPPHRMEWTGGMPLGLFKGVRTYTLAARPDGGVAFAMREAFSGPLAPLIGKSIPDLQPAFDAFAAALKRRAERA